VRDQGVDQTLTLSQTVTLLDTKGDKGPQGPRGYTGSAGATGAFDATPIGQTLTVNPNVNSTGTASGSIIVSGGIGVSGNISVGGSIASYATIDGVSSSFTVTNFTFDTTGTSIAVAAAGTVRFPGFSGMIFVNDYTSGGTTLYLAGGGTSTAVAFTIGQVGTLNSLPAINGYIWQNTSGATRTYNFVTTRTRNAG
jgi:hypothetical protein